jgi:hypothetical protein
LNETIEQAYKHPTEARRQEDVRTIIAAIKTKIREMKLENSKKDELQADYDNKLSEFNKRISALTQTTKLPSNHTAIQVEPISSASPVFARNSSHTPGGAAAMLRGTTNITLSRVASSHSAANNGSSYQENAFGNFAVGYGGGKYHGRRRKTIKRRRLNKKRKSRKYNKL